MSAVPTLNTIPATPRSPARKPSASAGSSTQRRARSVATVAAIGNALSAKAQAARKRIADVTQPEEEGGEVRRRGSDVAAAAAAAARARAVVPADDEDIQESPEAVTELPTAIPAPPVISEDPADHHQIEIDEGHLVLEVVYNAERSLEVVVSHEDLVGSAVLRDKLREAEAEKERATFAAKERAAERDKLRRAATTSRRGGRRERPASGMFRPDKPTDKAPMRLRLIAEEIGDAPDLAGALSRAVFPVFARLLGHLDEVLAAVSARRRAANLATQHAEQKRRIREAFKKQREDVEKSSQRPAKGSPAAAAFAAAADTVAAEEKKLISALQVRLEQELRVLQEEAVAPAEERLRNGGVTRAILLQLLILATILKCDMLRQALLEVIALDMPAFVFRQEWHSSHLEGAYVEAVALVPPAMISRVASEPGAHGGRSFAEAIDATLAITPGFSPFEVGPPPQLEMEEEEEEEDEMGRGASLGDLGTGGSEEGWKKGEGWAGSDDPNDDAEDGEGSSSPNATALIDGTDDSNSDSDGDDPMRFLRRADRADKSQYGVRLQTLWLEIGTALEDLRGQLNSLPSDLPQDDDAGVLWARDVSGVPADPVVPPSTFSCAAGIESVLSCAYNIAMAPTPSTPRQPLDFEKSVLERTTRAWEDAASVLATLVAASGGSFVPRE